MSIEISTDFDEIWHRTHDTDSNFSVYRILGKWSETSRHLAIFTSASLDTM